MPRKRDILAALKREELQAVAERFDIVVRDRRKRDDLVDGARGLAKGLKEICRDLGLDDSGREKAAITARILGEDHGTPKPPVPPVIPPPAVSSPSPPAAGGGSLSRAAGEGRGGGPPKRTSPVRSETIMEQAQLNWITGFIWNIADDVLRDLYTRGKYRDVILPMTVLRRLDTLLEGTKQAVLERKAMLDKAGIVNQELSLRMLTAAEETLKDLAAQHGKQVSTHLYGQEINAETFAICKADLLLKGEREGRVRDQLHAVLLQAQAAALAGRDPG